MKQALLTGLSTLVAFATLGQACPNGDFENWNVRIYAALDSNWTTSNPSSLVEGDTLTVWPVTGFSGQAVHIQTPIIGTDTIQAYIVNSAGNPTQAQGGVPYSQIPTAITGYYRYNLAGNDSAGILVIFKKAGIPIAQNLIKIRGTGSLSSFTAFSFPLASMALTPDTVIIAATSSDLFTPAYIASGSWLELDQLAFTGPGVTQAIPGGTFDSWPSAESDQPDNWIIANTGNSGTGVSRTTDHYAGSYALQLKSIPGGDNTGVSPGIVTTGQVIHNVGMVGGQPYTLTTDTLTGYYKYAPAGTDSGAVNVSLYLAGTPVGGAFHPFLTASAWTYFEIPFSTGTTPDTMRIDLFSSVNSATVTGSILKIDYLQLKSNPLPPVSVTGLQVPASLLLYPNPVIDELNIATGQLQGATDVWIYDLTGRTLFSASYNATPGVITVPVTQVAPGINICAIRNNGVIYRQKFVKE